MTSESSRTPHPAPDQMASDSAAHDGPSDQSTMDTAKHEASTLAHEAQEGGHAVADTAKREAEHVAGEAKDQISELVSILRSEVAEQASGQQGQAAGALHSIAKELRAMADSEHGDRGTATGIAQQAADRTEGIASWIADREPADLLDEARSYARRKPGTFLLTAAVAGFLGARLMRGLQSDSTDNKDAASGGTPGTTADGAPADRFRTEPSAPAPSVKVTSGDTSSAWEAPAREADPFLAPTREPQPTSPGPQSSEVGR